MSRVNPWKITGYKAGQNVVCKVSHAEPGGYAVIIPKDNLPGFLPTEQPLKAGEEVLAQYVCVSNSRILLQCRFGNANTKPGAPRHDSVRWEEQLDQINSPAGAKIDYHRPSDGGAPQAQGYQDNYQQADYAQEFDGDTSQQGDYHFSNEQYAANYGDQQGQYATGQFDQSQHNQVQFDQSQYDQSQYDQSQYDQSQYDQNQYGQYQNDQYQNDQSQGGQQGYNGSFAQQPGFAPADNQGYQSGSYSPAQDYSQNTPGGNFGGPQNGGMQFKPSMPSDYAETQNSWSAAPNSSVVPTGQTGTGGYGAAPAGTPIYQAPVQDAGQYQGGQQSVPVSYQGPSADSPRPYPPHGSKPKSNTARTQHDMTAHKPANGAVAGTSPSTQSLTPSQAVDSAAVSTGHAPQQTQQPAYQSPGSYQGPAQTLPQYAPVIVPDERVTPKSPELSPDDDWGYSGQAWNNEPRLIPATVEAAPSAQIDVPASEADAAFRVWAPNVAPRDFHLKRATDLVPPPFDEDSLATFTSEEQDVEWLITDIEGGMRTGCVKSVSQSAMSRSAALLYKGRAVGCIYGRKQQSENYGTEQSLQIMLQDLEKPDTAIQLYDLPENIVLPMSALFLGYPVPREENVDARTYMDYMCNWFESKSQTACLAITFPSRSATSLCFIHEGKFCGAFYVEEQKFSQDKEFVYSLMQGDPQASVEANILPPEMTSSAVRFGFNLSMARKKVY
jgi:hypothetical protein